MNARNAHLELSAATPLAAALAAMLLGCGGAGSKGSGQSPNYPFLGPGEESSAATDSKLCEQGEATVELGAPGDYAVQVFAASAGAVVRVQASAIEADLELGLAIYGPADAAGTFGDGNPLAETLRGEPAQLDFLAPSDGLFLALVLARDGAGSATVSALAGGEATCNATGCDDSDPCTIDFGAPFGCAPLERRGCVPECKFDADCDDGDACTTNACVAQGITASCVFTEIDCDDGDPCTLDGCGASTGCVYADAPNAAGCGGPIPDTCGSNAQCDDGDACTDDACVDGACVTTPSGALDCGPPLCDDGDPFTLDAGLEGNCSHTPIEGCTPEKNCDSSLECNDNNACTTDFCSGINGNGTCKHSVMSCSDDQACTANACDPKKGCVFPPITGPDCPAECERAQNCEDGDPCTIDTCVDGQCEQSRSVDAACAVACADNNPCTTDSGTAGNCVFLPIAGCNPTPCAPGDACNDGNACTTDSCKADKLGPAMCNHAVLDCDDDNPCTQDSCNSFQGCTNAGTVSECDDGDPCTTGDACVAGACVPGENTCAPPDYVICKFTGEASSTAVCPLRLAAVSFFPEKFATGLQFALVFDPNKLALLGVVDTLCFDGAGCFDVEVAGEAATQPLSTGHSVSIAPTTLAEWNTQGGGAAIIVNIGDPARAITEAYLDEDGALVGDPVVLRMRFELLQQTGAQNVALVALDNVVAAAADSSQLELTPLTQELGILITSP
jgi:hypothetical protein